ncbi:MAG TPA: hypothetical protein VFY01_04100 [Rheinheimera sp.]|nr:hypothetical protein [Rheinheimera sp.]
MPETEMSNMLDFATLFGIALMFNAAASWLVFAQLSMRPLEKKLRALNKDTISDWDGPGWRVVTYAIKLIVPPTIWGEYNMFLDPFLLQKLATKRDTILATWMMSSWLIFIVFSVIYIELLI